MDYQRAKISGIFKKQGSKIYNSLVNSQMFFKKKYKRSIILELII